MELKSEAFVVISNLDFLIISMIQLPSDQYSNYYEKTMQFSYNHLFLNCVNDLGCIRYNLSCLIDERIPYIHLHNITTSSRKFKQ